MAEEAKKVTTLDVIIGFASFIPFLGVFLGLAAFIIGFIKASVGGWKVALLGLAGLLVNAGIIVVTLRALPEKFDQHMTQAYGMVAQEKLKKNVMALEYYKQVNGRYPKDLSEMAPKGQSMEDFRAAADLYDFSGGKPVPGSPLAFYQYELSGDGTTYRLFGVGADKVPGTSDDVFPVLTEEEMRSTGYRKAPSH